MTVQFDVSVRNARLDAIETVIGASPKLQLRTGAQPANCAATATGTLLAELTLPSDWWAAASNGSKVLAGSWSVAGIAAGTIAHYRLLNSAGTTCFEQGSVTMTGGGGDLTLDNTSIAVDQNATITTWTKTDGNA
jgi:sulfur carrier protein ThiS